MTGLYSLAGVAREKPALRSRVPLHGRAHAVAVAEIDVVAHADFVAVVEDRRSGKRKEQAVQKFDAAPVVVHQRRQAPADAEIDAHARSRRCRPDTCNRARRW